MFKNGSGFGFSKELAQNQYHTENMQEILGLR